MVIYGINQVTANITTLFHPDLRDIQPIAVCGHNIL